MEGRIVMERDCTTLREGAIPSFRGFKRQSALQLA